jgi:predicted DNA-binding transcriptional regulator AlpA
MQKPFHRSDLLDQRELSRELGMSYAAIDRALIERAMPMPSTGVAPGLCLWHRDEIRDWLARQSAPRYFMNGSGP